MANVNFDENQDDNLINRNRYQGPDDENKFPRSISSLIYTLFEIT